MATKTTRKKTTRATKRKTTTAKKATTAARKAKVKTAAKRKTTVKRKTTAKKKTVARKTTAKKTTAKKAAPKKVVTTAIAKAMNKSQILTHIADHTELSKKQISEVFECMGNLMHRHLRKRAAGEFTVPGLMKCTVKRKPATKARKGINPFTGEPTTFKAKPARNVVKVRPLKKLKEMAES
ncbi:MAG: HU family DNA-binding protein [Coxiellaceae bacterium]|nr:HU family DNA-binding protein [Coxiellaceae bacterium]